MKFDECYNQVQVVYFASWGSSISLDLGDDSAYIWTVVEAFYRNGGWGGGGSYVQALIKKAQKPISSAGGKLCPFQILIIPHVGEQGNWLDCIGKSEFL